MIRFESDYLEGAHPKILSALFSTNTEQTPGYGEDIHCEIARELIRRQCDSPDADVHFLVGGTQANTTVIAACLRSHQGVIAADTAHIAVHETGAIESTGHKVLTLPGSFGKITAEQIDTYCAAHYADPSFEHAVQPGMVYISFPTELGTIYSKKELTEISDVCRRRSIPLFLDGARLGYGLMCDECDLTLSDIARLCDVFYIGGTKVGALFGEAVVITAPYLKCDFRYHIKQHGGMLAKGRLLGIQFEELFASDLYWSISRSAVQKAMRLKNAFRQQSFEFYIDSPTNQQFVIMDNAFLESLSRNFSFSLQARLPGDKSAVRFCTSWATTDDAVDALIAFISEK